MSSTVKAASMIAAGQATVAGMVPAKVAALTKGVMKSMMLTKLKIMAGVIGVLGMVAFAGGLSKYPTATARPLEKAMPMPNSPAPRPVATKAETDSDLGYIKSKVDRQGYKAVFIKALAAMAEHFEDIRYANQYDGRIEAWSQRPVDREGFLSIKACDDEGYYIAIRIKKVIAAGTESVRDTELERVILQRLNAQQDNKKRPPAEPREGSSPLLGYGTAAGQQSEGKKSDAVASPKGVAQSDKDSPVPAKRIKEAGKGNLDEADLVKFQGTWSLLLRHWKGHEIDNGPATLMVKGDACTVVYEKGTRKATWRIKLDATKQPKQIDFLGGGEKVPGIYKLDGTTLLICQGQSGKDRPSTFDTEAESDDSLFVFRRLSACWEKNLAPDVRSRLPSGA
jgi:uncharacterized protein (TIGR03067 family)